MARLRQFFSGFVLFLFAMAAGATDYEIKVCRLQSHSTSNAAYLKPCDTWETKNVCKANWVAWDVSEFQGEAMYSTALAALLAGSTVHVRVDGESCYGGYDEITMIRIDSDLF